MSKKANKRVNQTDAEFMVINDVDRLITECDTIIRKSNFSSDIRHAMLDVHAGLLKLKLVITYHMPPLRLGAIL